jgi:hypothetical protein
MSFMIFIKGSNGSDWYTGKLSCQAMKRRNVHATTSFLDQDAIRTSHRGICVRVEITMRHGIIRVIAQGQTKNKTSIRPGLLLLINKDARIRLLCSYKSRCAPSMVFGVTPHADLLIGLLIHKLTRRRRYDPCNDSGSCRTRGDNNVLLLRLLRVRANEHTLPT